MNKNLAIIGAALPLLLGSVSGIALAQGTASSGVIEEVIVTAQKRAESLQNVPISMAVFSANMIEKKNISTISNLAEFTPSLNIAQTIPSRVRIRIRGVGSRKFDVGAEGSIGVFVDEIYMPRFSGLSAALLDVERIEVLKGPQGTLFGRNTPGGAISIITQKPKENFEGFLEAGYGNKDSFLVRGSATGAVVPDKLRLRLSAGYEDKGGFASNATTGHSEDRKSTAARLQVAVLPTDRLTINASVEFTKVKQDTVFAKATHFPLLLQSPIIHTDPRSLDPRSDRLNLDGVVDQKAVRTKLRMDWTGDAVALTSLTGYQHTKLYQSLDFDYTSLNVGNTVTNEKSDTFSQELRISSVDGGSATLNNRLQWLGGVYYYHDIAHRTDSFIWGADSLSVFLAHGPTSVTNTPGVDITTESIAAFGQLTYALASKLDLTVGGRYTQDKKTFTLTGVTTAPGVPPLKADYVFSDDRTWKSFDPKVTLTLHLSDKVMTYATYSRGFKSGGVQFAGLVESVARQVYNPEHLNAYEIGLKSDLLDGSLRMNVAAFLYDYKDLQQQKVLIIDGSPSPLTTNAASSKIKGIDLDVLWIPVKPLTLRLAYSYLDAKFNSFLFDPINNIDYSGNTMPSSPKHSLSVGGSYDVALHNGWGVTLSTDWFWTDQFNFDPDMNDVLTRQDAYLTGSAQVELASPDDRYSITGYVTNITDKLYASSVTRQGPAVLRTYADGRRFGVRARVRF